MTDGVEIEERLRRVLSRPITGVEDRYRGDHGRAVRRPLLIMANDDSVGVATYDAHGIFDRLALDSRRKLARVLGRDDVAAELEHRRLEGESGTRRWLVKDGGQREPGEWGRIPRQVSHAVGGGKEPLDPRAIKLPDVDDVPHRGDRLAIHYVPSRSASIVAPARQLGTSKGKSVGNPNTACRSRLGYPGWCQHRGTSQ